MNIFYEEFGNGKPILLIHGFAYTEIFNQLIPLLSQQRRIILIHLPGFGKSPQPSTSQAYAHEVSDRIEQLQTNLRIKTWDVIAYSFGTRAIDYYVQKNDSKIDKIFYIAPAFIEKKYYAHNIIADLFIACSQHIPVISKLILDSPILLLLIYLLADNGTHKQLNYLWYKKIREEPFGMRLSAMCFVLKKRNEWFFANKNKLICIWAKEDKLSKIAQSYPLVYFTIPGFHNCIQMHPEVISKFILSNNSRQNN